VDLSLRGAHEHNLKHLDLTLPLGQWIAVTGPSGSGKTSLAFDTLVREGQRRYLGSLSARARQFLGKLGRAAVGSLEGLPATIAVGQASTTGHARSTVGTLSGVLPLLRVLYAREAADPEGTALGLSAFSFNHPDGACQACQGLGVEDQVDPALLVADADKSIRQGALRPTLKNGYTVYSQVTLEVMDRICQAHGFDVDTPWGQLNDAQRDVIFHGTKALKVPFGKHSIESRMRWEGITARPREEGYYRGLVPVLRETLKRNRNENVLRYVRSVDCSACGGTRLARAGREARLGQRTLPQLLALPARELVPALDQVPASPVWDALREGVEQRLGRLVRLGLGHLTLARQSTTLSGGEAQRLRLAAQLAAGLGGLLVALDEPTLGLHPEAQAGMAAVLDDLRALGNTLLVVEHDPDMVRRADHLLSLGPGAGPHGGQLLHDGPPPADPLGPAPCPRPRPRPREPAGRLALRGATLHGLKSAALDVVLGAFNVVLGPSGAGKSSLVFGTLLPALEGKPSGPYDTLTGVPAGLVVKAVDASPIGRTPRSTPATWSGLFDLVRKRFATTPEAKQRGWTASRFSYNVKAGRCGACEGLGVERIGLHLLADVERPCATCGGGRYAADTLGVTLRGQTIASALAMTVDEALAFFAADPPLASLCQALHDLGLGYLRLGQSSTTLSRGEAQRVKLATLIGRTSREPALLLMDEPDRGLHPDDVARLLRAIEALLARGHTVLAISHHRHVWAAADALTELRDGVARPDPTLRWEPLSVTGPPRPPVGLPPAITLEGVRTHNLRGVDVTLPHRRLTVLAGVSGGGKSSLAFATLAAEASRRFAESLPFHVRRHLRRLPRPELETAAGLSPTVALRQRQGSSRAGPRSTVATQTGLGPLLRLLWSRAGLLEGQPCRLTAEHFSPDSPRGACLACEGRGAVQRCSPARLLSDPSLPLHAGAMAGTKPGAFFGEPDGQYMATLAAALAPVGLDQPWDELPPEAQHVALYGAGERVFSVRWEYRRGRRSGEHTFEGTWDGLCALVEREARIRASRKNAAAWSEPLVDQPCEACGGSRLAPEPRRVRLHDLSLPDLLALPLAGVRAALELPPRDDPRTEAVLQALLPEILGRVEDMYSLGLGHLSLDRRSRTLSDGELQRTRLASVLHAGMTGLTVVLDEPGAGLHVRDLGTLLDRLTRLRDAGNTVVVVSHRPRLIRAADHLIELGPGAGREGGVIVAAGPPAEVLAGDTPTASALRHPPAPPTPRPDAARIELHGVHLHNLRDLDLDLPASGFVAVTGVSGSGKSSLVFDVLGASTAAGAPRGCTRTTGLDRFREIRSSRAARRGDCPLTCLGLLPALQALYLGAAEGSGLTKQSFSFRSPAGRCAACQGSGREAVALEVLADLQLPCPACEGRRYRPEVLAVTWSDLSVAEFLDRPVQALAPRLPQGKLQRAAQALTRLGLGHLTLGRRHAELSGGEAQRLVLAASLVHAPSPALYLLDEPATGLHEQDLTSLVQVLREIAARGDLVVAAVHRVSLIRAADEVLELGPGGGPDGGAVVAQGPPSALSDCLTSAALEQVGC
jgi:excinuclease ABC subunit A